ncbi:MAG TPA: M13-type metalloendopeptidase [Phenylobacterium sp.]|uniref:M13 family metallopeptidase n=1 Tax=Phenylobacterium sp. TaxID=1871053 RepID=UPI002B8BF133|nr:M13-type metalloendopeptidase [Phenylobacterium sp.]HXA38309.1 M13-type metalloendopeptidase [Phenylobacterium sp.]
MKIHWLGAAAAAALLAAGSTLAHAEDTTPAPAHAKARPKAKAKAKPPAAPAPAAPAGPAPDIAKAPRMGAWGFDLAGRDPATPPGQDFFQYANGGYEKSLVIPADRASFGAFDALNELSQSRLHALLDKAAADGSATGEQAKVGALYRSFMDEAKVSALGAKPMAADLAAIKAEKTKADVARAMGRAQHTFGGSLFAAAVQVDGKDPDRYAVYLNQAGLALPDRDYYLEKGFAKQKAAYEAYVARMLTLAKWPNAAANAKAIVALETEIARDSWTRAEQRDDDRMYNAYETAKLAEMAPGFDWSAFMAGAGLGQATRVVAQENTAFPKLAAIYARTPVETLKAWQAFNLVDQAAPYLSQAFVDARFDFRGKGLNGQPAQRPRWKRGVQLVDGQIGEALGKVYVAAYFPPESKAKMLALVGDIRTAMKGRIERLDWMSQPTKTKALEKLAAFTVKIGYPDKWRDYSGLTIRDDDLYGNVQRATTFDWDFRVGRLGGPVDRAEWGMTPPTINAYYNPNGNEIVFPAAILAPPFFDPEGDMAVNYGAIGGVIGHETTHGFDDQGRHYDGSGRLTDWWTPEDAAKFQAETVKLGKQYGAFEVLPGARINGDLTMGENIADLGGLLLALDAYHTSLHGQPAPIVDGLTGDQRVFLGWAQVWRGKTRDDALRQQLVSDPHSPERARVDVPMRNVDAFYAAFGLKPGDAMYVAPADRVRIW